MSATVLAFSLAVVVALVIPYDLLGRRRRSDRDPSQTSADVDAQPGASLSDDPAQTEAPDA